MAASYPSSAKSFSTKVDGVDLVQAAHINEIQDEIKAVEDQLIASKLSTLTSAPAASKVLTTDGSGNPTWEDYGAWTAFTPTVTSASGAFGAGGTTSSGRYFQTGKIVFFDAIISVTDVGTAATYVNMTLPVTARAAFKESCSGIATVTSSGAFTKSLISLISTSGTILRIYDTAGAFPAVNLQSLIVTGFYEAA